jgi:hypothetical protein
VINYIKIIKSKYEDTAPSRRQIAEWLSQQEVNQLYRPSKGETNKQKILKVVLQHQILYLQLIL